MMNNIPFQSTLVRRLLLRTLIACGLLVSAIGILDRVKAQQPRQGQGQAKGGRQDVPPSPLASVYDGGQYPKYPRVDTAAGYQLVPAWPQRPTNAARGATPSIAIDPSGNIWTFNRSNIPIQIYRPDGTLVRTWGEGMFSRPHQLRFDHEGNVWAVDDDLQQVIKFSPEGKPLL